MRLPAALAACACLLACTASATPASASPAARGPRAVTAWLSTYDRWSNSPPGCGIEYARNYGYPTVHDCAGGTGTYADPVTFAAPRGWLKPGTRIYVPVLRRYFVLEDLCSSCTVGPQADLWVGGVSRAQESDASPADIVNLWRRAVVILRPPRGEPVNAGPLRDVRTPKGAG